MLLTLCDRFAPTFNFPFEFYILTRRLTRISMATTKIALWSVWRFVTFLPQPIFVKSLSPKSRLGMCSAELFSSFLNGHLRL